MLPERHQAAMPYQLRLRDIAIAVGRESKGSRVKCPMPASGQRGCQNTLRRSSELRTRIGGQEARWTMMGCSL